MAGRHRVTSDRRELYANTIASWTWSQGTLVVSILTVPLLTRLLSQEEYGLWIQLLSMSALATAADMGMSLVFLRRITDNADSDRTGLMRSAAAFYQTSTTILTTVLVIACTIPGGLLSPYLRHTSMPLPAALAVIAAIAVNLRCQTPALSLLAKGRMDLTQIFGAGPAVVGTLATVLTAYWFRTAAAVAFAYAAVEIAFDVALVITAHRYSPARRPVSRAGRHTFGWWARLWYESTGVVMIDVVPTVSLLIGITVVSHVAGPAAAALYGVAGKVGSLVRRFITPFTESLYVSLCRATAATSAVAALVIRLATVALATGITAAFVVVAAGPIGMQFVFGRSYGSGVWVVLVMILADTIRSIYRPFLRKIQSENGIGSLRLWFVISMVAQFPLAVLAADRWSTVGVAITVLACTLLFEAVPTAWKLSIGHRLPAGAGRPALGQALAVFGAACLALLLAAGRQRLGIFAVGFAAAGAVTTGLVALHQVLNYLAKARFLRSSSLVATSGDET